MHCVRAPDPKHGIVKNIAPNQCAITDRGGLVVSTIASGIQSLKKLAKPRLESYLRYDMVVNAPAIIHSILLRHPCYKSHYTEFASDNLKFIMYAVCSEI